MITSGSSTLLALSFVTACTVLGCTAESESERTDPEQDPSRVDRALTHAEFNWTSATTPYFTVHAVQGSHGAEHLEELLRAIEAARKQDLELLGDFIDAPHLQLFFVTSREQMGMLVDYPAGGMAVPKENAVFFVHRAEGRPQLRHELMHVLAYHRWGERSDSWVSEGLATFASESCGGYSFRELASTLAVEDSLIPLEEFADKFSVATAASYIQAASVVEYVHGTYGLSAVRTLWQHGLDATVEALGIEVVELESAWRRWLMEGSTSRVIDWASIRACE